MAQATSAATSRTARRRRPPAGDVRAHAPRPHVGRLAVLALALIAAALFVSPLRAFFVQQTRYEKAAAQLQRARRDNVALEREVKLLTTKAYIAQVARSDANLVPRDMQLFVIKGLPGKDDEIAADASAAPAQASLSVLGRVEDLWHTLLH